MDLIVFLLDNLKFFTEECPWISQSKSDLWKLLFVIRGGYYKYYEVIKVRESNYSLTDYIWICAFLV